MATVVVENGDYSRPEWRQFVAFLAIVVAVVAISPVQTRLHEVYNYDRFDSRFDSNSNHIARFDLVFDSDANGRFAGPWYSVSFVL